MPHALLLNVFTGITIPCEIMSSDDVVDSNRTRVGDVIFLLPLTCPPSLILQKWLVKEDCGAVDMEEGVEERRRSRRRGPEVFFS